MRINVEEKFWGDERFLILQQLIYEKFKLDPNTTRQLASGAMLNAWHVAQRYWCPHKKLIPIAQWDLEVTNADLIISSSLAVKKNKEKFEIYVCGTKEMNKWYFDLLHASRKGVKALKKKHQHTAIPTGNLQERNSNPTGTPPAPAPAPAPKRKERKESKNESADASSRVAAVSILEYLNQKTGKNFRTTTKQHINHIAARLASNTTEELKRVIDNMLQNDWFVDNGLMNPETLFGSDGKVDRYLNTRSSQKVFKPEVIK